MNLLAEIGWRVHGLLFNQLIGHDDVIHLLFALNVYLMLGLRRKVFKNEMKMWKNENTNTSVFSTVENGAINMDVKYSG